MLIITDNDLVEGVIGILSLFISVLFLQNLFNTSNLLIIGIFFWCILWFLRKIGMNIYKDYKEKNEIEDKKFSLEGVEINTNQLLIIGGVILFICLFFITKDIHSINLRNIFSLNIYEILLVCIVVVCFLYLNNKENENISNKTTDIPIISKSENKVNVQEESIPEANREENLNSINNIEKNSIADETNDLTEIVNNGQNLNDEFVNKYFKNNKNMNKENKEDNSINNQLENSNIIDHSNSVKKYVKQKNKFITKS